MEPVKRNSKLKHEEMAELSKQHGMEMFQQQDETHLKAMQQMQGLMKNQEEMNNWFEARRQEFENLSES